MNNYILTETDVRIILYLIKNTHCRFVSYQKTITDMKITSYGLQY